MSAGPPAGSGLTSVVALSLWLGAALLVVAVVAPAAFAVLPTRTLAGALVGRVLPVLFWSGAAVGLLVVVLGRAQEGGARLLAGVALSLACLAAQLAIAPRIGRLRAAVAVPIDRLAPDDARRIAFGRLHAASVAMLGIAALAGSAALLFTVRALVSSDARAGLPNSPQSP
ncbi:MAG TPA: DUF4149 domain-containing protein [Gemmatimonadaceae bacterium]|nr:DUF4149 domain-containing protein [Gemmatimonadaceae bacterium]